MTFTHRTILAGILLVSLDARMAQCGEPVALVEEISPGVKGILAFDYVFDGDKIELGAEGRITLGYLAACAEENIQGGRVTVGGRGSIVAGGTLSRRPVPCPIPVRPTAVESSQSGAMVFRAPPVVPIGGTYPLIIVPAPGRVIIKPVSGHDEAIFFDVDGHFIDLASRKHALRINTAYRIEYADRQIIVRVSSNASDSASVFAQLIRF